MEKLTEKINTFNICKSLKADIIVIVEKEQLQIQQVCRKLLTEAVKKYKIKNKFG